jgi:PfaB family protein
LHGLDPVFLWTIHAARQALRSAGHDVAPEGLRTGLVMGNLSYPSRGLSRFAESVWTRTLGQDGRPPDPRNRFMSGLPAFLAARALRMEGVALCLDAACASSLYAIKLACDRLHDGSHDLVVAGAVNAADNLFLRMGFTALTAMSPTGQSRPFHKKADGLLPAEGAAFVALKRLEDAAAAGDRILGVIRGIGLSNDGRAKNLLAPAEEGEVRAMRAAYAQAGLSPADISLVECHAVGTQVADATEVRSLSAVFEGCQGVPMGSLKSNMGHLMTAAGAAALIKVLGAFRAGTRPPTLHVEEPQDGLRGSPMRLLAAAEPWDAPRPRRAAVSAFGFGGNNAHLIVEEWDPASTPVSPPYVPPPPDEKVAVVGVGAVVADGTGVADFARSLFLGQGRVRVDAQGRKAAHAETVSLQVNEVRFPPRDLKLALPQQLLLYKASLEAAAQAGDLPSERTWVLVGMGCDTEVARYCARWRVGERACRALGGPPPREWTARARDCMSPPLESAGVVGTMPNIPANRLSSHFDLRGPSFTLSAEEISGTAALEVGAEALLAGQADAVLVGGVDVCSEPAHEHAARHVLGEERATPGDAAIVLVLKRLSDATRAGNTVLAVLEPEAEGRVALRVGGTAGLSLVGQFGHPHAASALLQVAAGALACHHAALPRGSGRPASSWLAGSPASTVVVDCKTSAGPAQVVRLTRAPGGAAAPLVLEAPPRLHVYSGANRAEVRAALAAGHESESGPARLVIVASEAEHADRSRAARAFLESPHGGKLPEGVYFRESPLGGDLAFVYPFAATAYPGMGRELFLAVPDVVEEHLPRLGEFRGALAWMGDSASTTPPDAMEQLCAYSLLCHVHTALTRGVLGLKPDAALGLCTGESSALFSLGAWEDLPSMLASIRDTGLYTRELAGEWQVVRRAWSSWGVTEEPAWTTWRVFAPADEVRVALEGERLAHLAIIHAPSDCVVVGHPASCQRVIARLFKRHARNVGPGLALHCPEVESYAGPWRALHERPTREVPGVRFYANATGRAYIPCAQTAADALLGQAETTVNFPRTVGNAYAEGVRVFVEHGPKDLCTGFIHDILGSRPHVAVALDAAGTPGTRQVFHALADLVAAGVRVNHAALAQRWTAAWSATAPRVTRGATLPPLSLPAHMPPVVLPPIPARG